MNSDTLSAPVKALATATADATTAVHRLNAALSLGNAQGGLTADPGLPGLPGLPAPQNTREQIAREFPDTRLTFGQQQLLKTERGARKVLADLRARAELEAYPLNRREHLALKYGGVGAAARLLKERHTDAAKAAAQARKRVEQRITAYFGWDAIKNARAAAADG